MHHQRKGFRPGESIITHSRRRFRLTPGEGPPDPHRPSPDPSLWLIQYAPPYETEVQIPTKNLRIGNEQRNILAQRSVLLRQEFLRKEFMLYDHEHWPNLKSPPPARGHAGHLQQDAGGSSSAKRVRQSDKLPLKGNDVEKVKTPFEEPDTAVGDMMDYLTPREISHARFTQHAKWMEEIFSSPYETGSIVPSDLGLGRKGELERMTRAFFDAPMHSLKDHKRPVGRLEDGKADDFHISVTSRLAQLDAEIAQMKRKHTRDLAALREKSRTKSCLERIQRLEFDKTDRETSQTLNEIVSYFERSTGKRISPVAEIKCIQRGGLEEKTVQDDRANALLNPNNAQIRGNALPTMDVSRSTQNGIGVSPNKTSDQTQSTSSGPSQPLPVNDVEMDTLQHAPPAQGATQDDWVMVGRDHSPTKADDSQVQSAAPLEPTTQQINMEDVDITTNQEVTDFAADAVPDTGGAFDTTTFDDAVDFGNLDTAGDALAGFTPGDTSLTLGEHDDMGLADSAFGDAFHADNGASLGENQEMPDSEMQE